MALDDAFEKDMERAAIIRMEIIKAAVIPPLRPSNYVACLMAFLDIYASMKYGSQRAERGQGEEPLDIDDMHAFVNSDAFKEKAIQFITAFIRLGSAVSSTNYEVPLVQ